MEELKSKIIASLEQQGFNLSLGLNAQSTNKNVYKGLHKISKLEGVECHKDFLTNSFNHVKPFLRNAVDINPCKIDIELRYVKPNSLEEIIFRWWNLVWWSVPYQRPYGRQMRFVLWDKGHDAPFGIIGLQSPILKMSVRDKALEIPASSLDIWVNQSMQAQRLGALPPYNDLLGGKMVALAVTSNDIREAYLQKYSNQVTILKNRVLPSDLLFITTTSAFGRSSIYNRLKYKNHLVAKSLGFTKGSGTFHISETLYKDILDYLAANGVNTGRAFGTGPSRRIKLLHLGFKALDLPDYVYHNIKREFFIFSFIENLKGVIAGSEHPKFYNRTLSELQEFWLNRWALKRPNNKSDWNTFNYNEYLTDFSKEYNITF
jgi:hypothetical protein